MVIGGIAIIARGVRRMTTDIDAVVRGDRVELVALLRFLAQSKIVPRIDDIHAFASESLVLLLRHEPTGVELDVSMGWTAFEHEAIAAWDAAGQLRQDVGEVLARVDAGKAAGPKDRVCDR